ncbi:MAG TPA: metallophosphoesterase [Polyangiaceae bacterium]
MRKRRTRSARSQPDKTVVVGDLNGADDVLIDLLHGTGLIDRRRRWIGGASRLVQMGDLFNRGGGALRALRLLLALRPQARRAGGDVTLLLGNHEVMTALRNEAYCTEDEYLAFATAKQRREWPARVRQALIRLARTRTGGVVLPIAPRLEAWKLAHVPGKRAMRRALAANTTLGRALRAMPIVHVAHEAVFVHGGLLPEWARLGVEELNRVGRQAWAEAGTALWSVPRSHLFRRPDGPLWDRSLAAGTRASRANLRLSLRLLGARRMIIGHTQTSSLRGGETGKIAMVDGSRLVLVDVGLRSGPGTPRAALILSGSRGVEWTPAGTRLLWDDTRDGA